VQVFNEVSAVVIAKRSEFDFLAFDSVRVVKTGDRVLLEPGEQTGLFDFN